MERREEQVNETSEGNRSGAQTPEPLSTKLNRLTETARRDPSFKFQNIAHLITVEKGLRYVGKYGRDPSKVSGKITDR